MASVAKSSPTATATATGVAPPSSHSAAKVIRSAIVGVFGYIIAFTIIDAAQRYRGTATEGAANVNNLPALQMVAAHFSSTAFHDAIKQLALEIVKMELFWFSVVYIVLQRPIRTFFQYGAHYNTNKAWFVTQPALSSWPPITEQLIIYDMIDACMINRWKTIMWNYNLTMSAFSFCTLSGSAYAVLKYGIMVSTACNIKRRICRPKAHA